MHQLEANDKGSDYPQDNLGSSAPDSPKRETLSINQVMPKAQLDDIVVY